jgi:putative transposase
MTPNPKDTKAALDGQEARATFRDFVQEQVRVAIRATFIDILEEEVSQFIGASRYQRTAARRDQRAGHRSRTIGTTAGVIDDLPVPRTRGGFRTQLFERYQRRMPEVDGLIRDMFVGGVSQQQVGSVVEQLTGNSPVALDCLARLPFARGRVRRLAKAPSALALRLRLR